MPTTKIKKKHPLDKFYTKPSVAKICIDKLRPFLTDDMTLLEPSAGNGSFSKQIPCQAFDIAPDDPSIRQQDYLLSEKPQGKVCVFGNPPFGSRNDLAKAFIRHSLGATIIAFILPRVFEKATYQKVFPPDWGLAETFILPEKSFLLNTIEYHIPCAFQIWVKNGGYHDLREKIVYRTGTIDFKIVSKHEDSDLFVFGASPSKYIQPSEVTPNNRGYYLKITEGRYHAVKKNLDTIDWKAFGKSSVQGGVFWLTKTEFIEGYESVNE